MLAGMWDGMTLIAGRDCGECTVCCVAPSIDKPEIQKLSGARLPALQRRRLRHL